MPSRHAQGVVARDDAAADALVLRDVLAHYELLARAVGRANLWHELAWDGQEAAADARRDVARGRAALARLAGRVGG